MPNRRDRLGTFILTHGRPHNQMTLRALERHGFTGPVHLLVDDQDDTLPQYLAKYGDQVVVFDKAAAMAATDQGDIDPDTRAVVYARNACFGVAQQMGYDYLLQLDDDYTGFHHRYITRMGEAPQPPLLDMDETVERTLAWLESSPQVDVVAWAQGGDHVGGASGRGLQGQVKRKAMNVLFARTTSDIRFLGKINEDCTAYVALGQTGRVFLTIMRLRCTQQGTQQQDGGLTDIYLHHGTYVKSFYTVMWAPSCTRVRVLQGEGHPRIHHHIDWDACTPKILSDRHRKERHHADH